MSHSRSQSVSSDKSSSSRGSTPGAGRRRSGGGDHDKSESKSDDQSDRDGSRGADRSDHGDHGDRRDRGDQPPRKRQRVRLSCLECRRRKLSCDRGFPCERCIKSGTPERCTYETRPGLAPPAKNGLSQGALANFDARLAAFSIGTVGGPISGSGSHGLGGPITGGMGSGIGGVGIGSDAGLVRPYRRDSQRVGNGVGDLSGSSGSSSNNISNINMSGVDRMRRLELEVAQLKMLLTGAAAAASAATASASASATDAVKQSDGSTTLHDDDSPADKMAPDHLREQSPPTTFAQKVYGSAAAVEVGDELRFFRGKEFKTRYFGPHNACMAFSELTGLCPFMKETAEEWLRPLQVHHHQAKDRAKRKLEREERFRQPDLELEALLPSREETDLLVNIYLDQFEQIYRIVHIPSFRRQYAAFWDPERPREAAFTALILAMLSISSCLRGNPTGRFVGMVSQSHHMAARWIAAADGWNQRQSQKHRKLVHYQVACLAYLARRVNTMKKKRFWKSSGALTQDAVSVGLHRDPSHIHENVSVYNQEMRRRIWSTIQEFDMQASFDHGLPTLLSALRMDVHPPRNLADEDFDEDSTELPPSRPTDEYTFSSYQYLSRQSLPLRLQLSRVLTGPPDDLDYDQVIRYTNDLTQEIDALPSWDVRTVTTSTPAPGGPGGPGSGADGEASGERAGAGAGASADGDADAPTNTKLTPLLAYTLLHIQLRQYIIPLHQPFLKLRKTNSKYQYSEIIYYNAARDMVLLHDKLVEQGVRTLNFLREDSLTLSINLCSVTMLQSRGSTNMIMVNSQHTLKLLEKCLAMKEDRVLRCGNNEPWGYSIMCAATGLLEAHLGHKTTETAKASSAERFVNLHYKLLARQDPPPGSGAHLQKQQMLLQQQQQQQQQQEQRQGQEQEHDQVKAGRERPPTPSAQAQPVQLNAPVLPQIPPSQQLAPVNDALDRPKSITPFLALSQTSSQGGIPMAAADTPTAWWLANMATINSMNNAANLATDPTNQLAQPPNADFSLEQLGLNVGDLWADYSWEDM